MTEQLNGTIAGTSELSGTLSGAPGRTVTTTNYEELQNKPKINGVELIGDRSFEDLGLNQVYADKETVEKLQQTIDNLVDGNEVAY